MPSSLPPPKAISNIRFQYNVDGNNNIVTGRNIFYNRTNTDGKIDEVMRVYDVFFANGNWYGNFEGGSLIKPVDSPEIRNYILNCETNPVLKNYKPLDVNIHRCGAVIYVKRLPDPKPTPEEEIKKLFNQVTQLSTQITVLTNANKGLSTANQQLSEQVMKLQTDISRVIRILDDLK